MRARSLLVVTALAAALALPAAASAQSGGYSVLVDNPWVDCDLPLPATMVVGELGDRFWVTDPAEIDKVTMLTEYGAYVVDVSFEEGFHTAEIQVSAPVSAYTVWSCAPLNGEPVQQNDYNEV
jgi:ABC-type sugar transport system substrate-binding protein